MNRVSLRAGVAGAAIVFACLPAAVGAQGSQGAVAVPPAAAPPAPVAAPPPPPTPRRRLPASADGSGSRPGAQGPSERGPSRHVRCDGNPNNVSGAETAARLLGAVTLLGLFAPPPEASDEAARLRGREGIAVCEALLVDETNEVRRAQLILANAIHYIEADDHVGAAREIERVRTDRPALAATRGFALSLGLSAIELEAYSLAVQGRYRDASVRAAALAAAAPYDIQNMSRASRYIGLDGTFGPTEEGFYADLVRIYPAATIRRLRLRQLAGNFAGAAEDSELWLTVVRAVTRQAEALPLAEAALAYALAGRMGRAASFAAEARTALERITDTNATTAIRETLDLYTIIEQARSGRMMQARLLFAGRSGWTAPSGAAVSAVAALLLEGAPASERTGLLEGDPARFRNQQLAQLRRVVLGEEPPANLEPGEKPQASGLDPFSVVRIYFADGVLTNLARDVWRTDRSRYFGRGTAGSTEWRPGQVNAGYGTTPGYALMLHTALLAQAEGKPNFMLRPLQASIGAFSVRFGTVGTGEGELAAPVAFDTARVIADLSPIIPRPVEGRR